MSIAKVATAEPAANTTTSGSTKFTPLALLTLGLLTLGLPLATDLYLPTFPAMMTDLSTSASAVQLSLSAFLVGAAVGQLVFGPLSDRVGRRGPLLIGLTLYVVFGVAATFATSATMLIVLRVLQGLSGAAASVLSRTIVTDRLSGLAATRTLNVLMAMAGIAPAIAPVLGGLLAPSIGWRGLLAVVAGIGLVTLILTVVTLPESLPAEARGRSAASADSGWKALANRGFLTHTVIHAVSFGSLLAYIAASPFIYQTLIGLSEIAYALTFGLNALGMLGCTLLASRLAGSVGPAKLMRVGIGIHVLAAIAFTVIAFSGLPPVALVIPLFIGISALGLVLGNSTALAMASVTSGSGLASAVLGTVQFTVGGLTSALVGLGGEGSAWPLGIIMTACGAIAVAMALLAQHNRKKQA